MKEELRSAFGNARFWIAPVVCQLQKLHFVFHLPPPKLHMSSGSNLIREQLIKEVESNLNNAILAAQRASMSNDEIISLLRLLLEVDND